MEDGSSKLKSRYVYWFAAFARRMSQAEVDLTPGLYFGSKSLGFEDDYRCIPYWVDFILGEVATTRLGRFLRH